LENALKREIAYAEKAPKTKPFKTSYTLDLFFLHAEGFLQKQHINSCMLIF